MDTQSAYAPAPLTESVIANPSTYRKPEGPSGENYIDPQATRWVFIPILEIQNLDGQHFGTQMIPANQFFPVRPVANDISNSSGGMTRIWRTPAEQMADIAQMAASETSPKQVVDLFRLSQLESERDQTEILQALANPNPCVKYPYQLKNRCATCWRNYLVDEAPTIIAQRFGDDERKFNAAAQTLDQMLNAFETSLVQAAAGINIALEQIDNKMSGKSALYDVDYERIRNTHSDMPKFRTSTDSGNDLNRLIDVLAKNLPQTQNAAVTVGDVQSMISESLSKKDIELSERDNEIAQLKAQIAQQRDAAPIDAAALKCGDTGGVNAKGEPCGNIAKLNGRCSAHQENQSLGE